MEEYRLERHLKLWDDNNKMIARVIFLSVVLSLSMIVKVLSPFVSESDKKRPHVETISMLKSEKTGIDEKINFIEQMEGKLVDVGHTISANPWGDEKNKLVKRYLEMNESPPTHGYSPEDYQKEGNQTISKIGDLLRVEIIQPLEAINYEANERSLDLSRLSNEVSSLHDYDKEWERQYINVNWYKTRDLKNETMGRLTNDIGERFNNINRVVADELESLKQARVAIVAKLDELNSNIEQEKVELEEIEKALDEILHKWLQGLISIKQVIQLLPLALLCVALYVMFAGLVLTRHYQIYADGKAFSASVKSDASMSSVWTLVPRGRYGTLLTVAVYVLFFLLVWSLLEKAIALLLAWIVIDPTQAWIGSVALWTGYLWLSRLLFLGLIGYVIILSWRRQLESPD